VVSARRQRLEEGSRPGAVEAVEAYVASLGIDAYLVGGVVRDELLDRESKDADFLVPGVDTEGLSRLLAREGRVEELVVAGRPVGVRLYPRAADARMLAPAGIEFAPVRRERSTGPGRHDFEIVVDPTAGVEADLARRDFTVNAMARRLGDGTLVDPFGGRRDLERGVLRTVGPRSLSEDPLRIVRGLRFVSTLGLEPDRPTLAQMREHAASVSLVSGERIGGGLGSDGMGELSRLLLGAEPERALILARETGVLVAIIPPFAPTIGFRQPGHELTLDDHIFRVVQCAADAGTPLRVRLAALLHDLGKPLTGREGSGAPPRDHAAIGADLAQGVLEALRYPNELRRRVISIVRFHTLDIGAGDAAAARRLLHRHGLSVSRDLLDHREADLRGKTRTGVADPTALADVLAFRGLVEEQAGSPHRLADLAVDGTDLVALGFRPGPALGAALATLLSEVVDDPARNRRAALLARAEELRGP
jgi:tRNA nucleotidyltransferase/poly(A) polymerase